MPSCRRLYWIVVMPFPGSIDVLSLVALVLSLFGEANFLFILITPNLNVLVVTWLAAIKLSPENKVLGC